MAHFESEWSASMSNSSSKNWMVPVVRRDGLVRLARPSRSSPEALVLLQGGKYPRGLGESRLLVEDRSKMRTRRRVFTLAIRIGFVLAILVTCTKKGDIPAAHWLGECAALCLPTRFPKLLESVHQLPSRPSRKKLFVQNHDPLLEKSAPTERQE